MIDPETVEFLESGCGLIVATAAPDLEPLAARGWGVTVLPGTGAATEIRLLLDAADASMLANLAPGHAIALTSGNVRTLESMQFKGRSVTIERATRADRERARRYADDFITAVTEADGTDPEKMRRLVPDDYVACVMRIDARYDQTPGPAAGTALTADAT